MRIQIMIDLTRERPVSIADVALMFGVHRRTVEGWFDVGLERIKVGGRIFTTKEALQRFSVHGEAVAIQGDDDCGAASRELEARFGV